MSQLPETSALACQQSKHRTAVNLYLAECKCGVAADVRDDLDVNSKHVPNKNINYSRAVSTRKDMTLPLTQDLDKREQLITDHGITAEYNDVWREYHATASGYCGAPDSECPTGAGSTSETAIDNLIEQLENGSGEIL